MDKKRLIVLIIIVILFSIAIVLSFLYHEGKYKVSFETGTDDVILTQYVSKNSKVNKPLEPEKEGYIFIEWQLKGTTYDFDTEVKDNIILSAKWLKEDYITVEFNTNTKEKIDSIKIIKGNKIDNLPNINREGYEFKGWYLNENLYNNEEINSDVVLTAQYKSDKIDTTYKVGDYVIITGKYSKSSDSKKAKNSKAIGWKRKILGINEDNENPYVVGIDDDVVGYFKAISIELVK